MLWSFQASSRGCPTFGPLEKVAESAEIADVELNLHGLMTVNGLAFDFIQTCSSSKAKPRRIGTALTLCRLHCLYAVLWQTAV